MPVSYPYTQYGGIWKLNAASAAQGAGTWPKPPSLISKYFSTSLYTGNGSNQTITNGIDIAGQGGLIWYKQRVNAAGGYNHQLVDTIRGVTKALHTNLTDAEETGAFLSSFNSDGFTTNTIGNYSTTFASWTFRKAPKFFDVVTYTGNGASTQTINHNLGIAPGMIIVKALNVSGQWWPVYHRSLSTNNVVWLNATNAASSQDSFSGSPTDTQFTVGANANSNGSGTTYVAYLFAHDTAGNGVIQCGSLTDTAGTVVNLGWQPQYILWKKSGSTSYWYIFDSARGMTSTVDKTLSPNSSGAEITYTPPSIPFVVSSTGFTWQYSGWDGTAGADAIYMAIRDPNS